MSNALGVATAAVLRSMMEHPDRRTAKAIAEGSSELDAAAAADGLRDLEGRGLASQDSSGAWSLTQKGREAAG
jgi:hypothetical protein